MYIINASISLSSFLFVDASTVDCPTIQEIFFLPHLKIKIRPNKIFSSLSLQKNVSSFWYDPNIQPSPYKAFKKGYFVCHVNDWCTLYIISTIGNCYHALCQFTYFFCCDFQEFTAGQIVLVGQTGAYMSRQYLKMKFRNRMRHVSNN